jgi:hypothetical protein
MKNPRRRAAYPSKSEPKKGPWTRKTTKNQLEQFERDKHTIAAMCDDDNPKTIKRRFQVFGAIQDIDICNSCKNKEYFQMYQSEIKL